MKTSKMLFARCVMLTLICVSSTMLSGCVSDELVSDEMSRAPDKTGSENYPITVAKGPVTLEVASSQGTLQPTQINAVTGFAHQAMSAGVTPLTISRPSGGGASARVASEIAALMTQQGVSRQMIRMATYPAPASAPVNISYVTTYAKTKPCGEWPEDLTETSSNEDYSSHGCAVQANIAAMVANPETFIVPSNNDPIRASSRVLAIKKLESNTTTNFQRFSFF
jgi:pilus assembly protein CpaD